MFVNTKSKKSKEVKEQTFDAARKRQMRAMVRNIAHRPVANKQRRIDLEHDDAGWLQTYFPDVFYNPFTTDQLSNIKDVGDCLRYGTKKCKAAPRGDGKSSVLYYLCLKKALYRTVMFPLIIASTSTKSEKWLQNIKARLRNPENKELFADFPFECDIAHYISPAPNRANGVTYEGYKVNVAWKPNYIILPSLPGVSEFEFVGSEQVGPIFMSLGITSDEIQGCNLYDRRPDFVTLDDLDSRDSLASNEGNIAAKVEQIIDKNVAGLGGPNKRLGQAMICTVPSRNSVAWKYSDPAQKPGWSGERIKRVQRWPEREDLWEKYIGLRQKGQKELGPDNKPIDSFGLAANKFYADHQSEMDAGAILSNPYDFEPTIFPDGSRKHLSALQKCYDFIADFGLDSFKTEHQNDPPEDEEATRTILTAYHVQHNCRSGLDMRICPEGTTSIVAGLDIKKLGFHFVILASDDEARGAIIEYNFHEISGAGEMKADTQAVERAILYGLHEWREKMEAAEFVDVHGNPLALNFALIDEGWKEETWAQQPARQFSQEAGLGQYMACKGWGGGNYKEPLMTTNVIVGQRCHISAGKAKVQHVNWDADHWKQMVHDGFMTGPGEPGSLTLFNPTVVKTRRQQPHMSFAKHITAEVWEERFVPGFKGWVKKWWKVGSQNHYFDATAQALVARSLLGVTSLPKREQPKPKTIQSPQQSYVPQNFSRERNF